MTETIAVLMTCHNRVEKTLKCLASLFRQSIRGRVAFSVFLVDDGSADKTGRIVQEEYPEINVIYGDGALFWNRGMHRAFGAALEIGFDFYLWLNDDTYLYPDAVDKILETYKLLTNQGGGASIVVGSARDSGTGEFTYGGYRRSGYLNPLRLHLVPPADGPARCDTMCGNCVLIPSQVAAVVGNIGPEYKHRWGDVDYGLRAQAKKCQVWIAPGFVADCEGNPNADKWRDRSLPFKRRLQELNSLKGLGRQDWLRFVRRHGGKVWPFVWVRPYLRVIYDTFR